MLFVDLHGVLLHIESHIGHVKKVIREVLLDHIPLVAGADDEVADAVGGVDFHDMPENRLASDLDHGLRPRRCLFTDAGAKAAR